MYTYFYTKIQDFTSNANVADTDNIDFMDQLIQSELVGNDHCFAAFVMGVIYYVQALYRVSQGIIGFLLSTAR